MDNNKNSQVKPRQANLQQQTEVLMPDQSERQRTQHALRMMAGFVIAAVVMTALYFGRDIFIPLALAILLAFLLSPLVFPFEALGLSPMGGDWPGHVLDLVLSGWHCNLSGGTTRQAESGTAAISGHYPAKTENARKLPSRTEHVGRCDPDL